MRRLSTTPPTLPAIRPIIPPMSTPDAMTAIAPHQLDVMPTRTRLKTSRPTSSVPKRWDRLGAPKGVPTGRLGAYGATRLAVIVTTTISPKAPKAIQAPAGVPAKALRLRVFNHRPRVIGGAT